MLFHRPSYTLIEKGDVPPAFKSDAFLRAQKSNPDGGANASLQTHDQIGLGVFKLKIGPALRTQTRFIDVDDFTNNTDASKKIAITISTSERDLR